MKAAEPFDLFDRVTIEPMTYWDLEQVMAIERASFARPWTPTGFRTELERQPAVCLVLREGFQVYGYLVFWNLPPEIHVLNIAVKPGLRRKGLGRLLLDYLCEYGREIGSQEIFLEVRPSNTGAMALYQKMGFVQTGRRKNYYAENKEDAILMTLNL